MSNLKFIINEKGNKTAAILPIEKYLQIIEDLHDLTVIAERRDEKTLSFEEIKANMEN